MPLVTFYFQMHQPFRLHPGGDTLFWEDNNRNIFQKVSHKCYLPATWMFKELVEKYPHFKLTLSMSGTFLEQAELYQPEVIKNLQALYDAGRQNNQVEFLEETYYHSLTSLFDDSVKKEFRDQVSLHRQKMKELFEIKPTAFRNTELMYNNDLAHIVADMGFRAILCEKRDDMFNPQDGKAISPNAVFRAIGRNNYPRDLVVIPRNRDLSDDVAFRFTHTYLSADQYVENIAKIDGEAVLLGYDYEHIGEHIWVDKGIFDFWRGVAEVLPRYSSIIVANPSEIAERFKLAQCPVVDIHPLATSSWADIERNTFGWLGNQTQYQLFKNIQIMEEEARTAGGELFKRWRQLTTSDHLYYLHEGKGADRTVHDYFSPYGSTAMATYLLTHNLDKLHFAVKNFNIRKKTDITPVIIITPETARLPSEGMGQFAQYVSGKSGGLGEVVSALCKGLVERKFAAHLITLNLARRFREESHLSEDEWVIQRHKLDPENVHLVTSAIFSNNYTAYDGDPLLTAAEFQTQVINTYIKNIQTKYEGRAIVHTHDWMAGGAISAYAKMRDIPSLHTVHNTHTAHIPIELLRGVSLDKLWRNLFISLDHGKQCLDAQATALKNATKISYVGKRFLKEIVEDYFMDRPIISWSVRQETKVKYLSGLALVIPNGISPELYPENQLEDASFDKPGLAKIFRDNGNVIEAKRANLAKFQHKIGLAINPQAILLYWPSRLDPTQKGIELLEAIAQNFVNAHPDVQIAVVGNPVGSDRTHADIMGRIACASQGRIAYHHFDEDLSILGYAAAGDVFGASLYEPFGQIDVLGNLYGATATNRDTGGYSDKIIPLSIKAWGAPQDRGNGVLFKNYDPGGLWWGLVNTVEHHRYFQKNPNEWNKQAKRFMREAKKNWSLENMVAGYITAYEELNQGKPLF